MKQLRDMPGLCKYCTTCLRVEDENFKSVYRCKDFEPYKITLEEAQKLVIEELRKNEI